MSIKQFSAALLIGVTMAGAAFASSDAKHPHEIKWPTDGIGGTFDRQAIQRGYKVFKQVCASCHGMKRIAFRNLAEIGFSEAEIKAIAAEYNVTDGPNAEGEMFERPAVPSDAFVSPFPNEQAARAANGGAYPPDLSLIIKARHDGSNYVHSLLMGYEEPPADVQLQPGQYYNPYFAGGKIGMPQPLTTEGQVEYEDGTTPSVDQMSRDVVQFLQWAAEPEMEQRKHMGIHVLIFLSIMTIFFYIAKKRIWAKAKG